MRFGPPKSRFPHNCPEGGGSAPHVALPRVGPSPQVVGAYGVESVCSRYLALENSELIVGLNLKFDQFDTK